MMRILFQQPASCRVRRNRGRQRQTGKALIDVKIMPIEIAFNSGVFPIFKTARDNVTVLNNSGLSRARRRATVE
jgi:hypothetical protein